MIRHSRTCSAMIAVILAGFLSGELARAAETIVLASGLKGPESVAVTADGRVFVTALGKMGAKGDGAVVETKDGTPTEILAALDDPSGIVARDDELFFVDKAKVYRIDRDGKGSVLVAPDAFPLKPRLLNDIALGPNGDFFVSDSGNFTSAGAVFRIAPDKTVTVVANHPARPELKAPNGLISDGPDHVLLNDFMARRLWRVALADGKVEQVAEGLDSADGIARDDAGRIYVSDWGKGRVFVIETPTSKPRVFLEGLKGPADLMYDAKKGRLLIPDMKAGTLIAVEVPK